MTSSREDDERVMEILSAARRMPVAEREAYLGTACAGDEGLRREVADALSWEERMGGFLQQPVAIIANENRPLDTAVTAGLQFSAGLEIGQYRIESKLGEGGMSTVWLALDTRLGRRVAIKFLSDDLADAETRRRFQREAQMASSLNHPHIVSVHDIGEFEGRQYLVTEYVDGGTLKDWVRDKPRTPQEVAQLLTGVADGLAAAHQAGILHRDIKPPNILVARNGYAKLADFGLAKLAESGQIDFAPHLPEAHTRQGVILGTIGYMSPEQASGQPLDARSDIFSFGIVLYEMLSGKRPFGGRTDLEVLKTIIHGEMPPFGGEVPEVYRSIVEKALEKNPAERYQSMREMVVDLRRGQRSAAPSTLRLENAAGVEDTIAPGGSKRNAILARTWLKIGVGISALAVLALAVLVASRWLRTSSQSPQEQEALTAVPFTALPGRAISPAFSPDGSRIAFAWNGDPALGTNGFDLYVKALGSETLLRLTQHPSEWISPTWSPDGTQIAFHRVDGADTGIYVVPALGGPERKLRSTRSLGQDSAPSSWSPDSKWIAFADRVPPEENARIYLLSTQSLETRQIPVNPMCVTQGLPAFSHNGEYLAYWCFRNHDDAALYSLALPDGKPKMIAPLWIGPSGLTWSADDKKLIYSRWTAQSSSDLAEVTVANGSVKRLAFEGNAMGPTVSSRGDKLAYGSIFVTSSIWRRDLLHSASPSVELFRSSRAQDDAQYSPDGKRIVFSSLRSGVQGVWIGNDDGSNLVQLSNPNDGSGSPQWSPDGNRVAFDSHPLDRWEIYVADVAEGKPRKLVTNISVAFRPRWSHDGKWIYFSSNETGRAGNYRCPASGGDAVLISKELGGFNPQESFDGKTVYFASSDTTPTLKKVPLPGQPGTESNVDELPPLSDARSWALTKDGIYFVSAAAPESLQYLDFAASQIRPIFEVGKGAVSRLSVSPDGRWILYSQDRSVDGDIMLVNQFR